MQGYTKINVIAVLSALLLCGGCANFNSSASDYAARNEAATQRQQSDQDKPALDNKQVYLEMIKKMQDRSLYFASMAHIDAYQKSYGSSPEIQRLYADALRATGQDDAAEKQYQQLRTTTEAAAAWHGLGLLAAQRGDSVNAIAHLRESNRRDPTNAMVLSDLSYALLYDGDRAAARLPLMQAVELAPDNRKVISNLALFFLLSNETAKAEALMKDAYIPADVRTEIRKRKDAIAARGTQPAAKVVSEADIQNRTLPAIASGNGMQLQLQLQLLQPNVVPRSRSE
ncbi:tetratricopeptide repeat protein [Herminiimonas arsenitoxidans]|uniref:pilus assembly protein n=1 Tax=Herminiimonas arsenitoxidans TaxID=1809410 RepID=UPI000970C163|nr:pilus assembly protein [Herminiimonas arsenitoxidans]